MKDGRGKKQGKEEKMKKLKRTCGGERRGEVQGEEARGNLSAT